VRWETLRRVVSRPAFRTEREAREEDARQRSQCDQSDNRVWSN
jgi:hypothetical protein